MKEQLDKAHLGEALSALGRELAGQAELILGGAGALILTGELDRTTVDLDVLWSSPDIGTLLPAIRKVSERLQLSGGWLNGSVQSYLEVLPPDFRSRLRTLPPMNHLQVSVLHRMDFIVMKLFAARPRDLDDLEQLKPTVTELTFARSQLPRLQQVHLGRATSMEAFLEQYVSQR